MTPETPENPRTPAAAANGEDRTATSSANTGETASTTPGPDRIGPYRIVSRLATSCCSVATYLAESPSGERVAVRHYADPGLRRPADPAALRRLHRAATVGTADILDIGPDHVVTEYVDGPSLEQEVRERGGLSGAPLQRLAIGTVTALAALHRAGVEHVEVRPDRIVLGPDGPRLIHHGPERHDRFGPSHETTPADSELLAWRTPEELEGDRPGPSADMFTWASVMAYAATGKDPFAADSTADTTKRLLTAAADLGRLAEGPLRDLLADCLVADPAQRPSAEDALLRLIGHSGALVTAVPDAPAAPAKPARPARPRRLLVSAAGVAILLLSGGISAGITLGTAERPAARSAEGPAATPTATWTPRPIGPAAPTPPAPERELTLPADLGTLYEHPSDPVRLTGIRIGRPKGGNSPAYARTPKSDTFQQAGPYNVVTDLSPDGRYLATMDTLYQATSNRLDMTFTDHLTGERFTVPLLQPPYLAFDFAWSRQSDHVVVNVIERETEGQTDRYYSAGFVIINVAARSSTFVPTTDGDEVRQAGSAVDAETYLSYYRWRPDGRTLASRYLTAEWGRGMRVRDLSGQSVRLLHWVGNPTGVGDWYSPSGELFFTSGCERSFATCVWRTDTAERVATVPAPGGTLIGWYDERHIIRSLPEKDGVHRVVAVDFTGKPVRLLAEIRAPASAVLDLRYTRG